MPDQERPAPELPESRDRPKKHTRLSIVWIVPMVAVVIGGWVAVTRIMNEGPTITILLRSAEGLEPGKSKVRYNGLDVGTLISLRLAEDHNHVLATVQMVPRSKDFLVEDTKFWVVSLRFSGASVT